MISKCAMCRVQSRFNEWDKREFEYIGHLTLDIHDKEVHITCLPRLYECKKCGYIKRVKTRLIFNFKQNT